MTLYAWIYTGYFSDVQVIVEAYGTLHDSTGTWHWAIQIFYITENSAVIEVELYVKAENVFHRENHKRHFNLPAFHNNSQQLSTLFFKFRYFIAVRVVCQ